MLSQRENDLAVQGIEISCITWSKMRGTALVQGDISYCKPVKTKGFACIFSVDIQDGQGARIQWLVSSIRAKAVPDYIVITPNTRPANLAGILHGEGFKIDDSIPGMVLDLDAYRESEPPAGLRITNVTGKWRLADWLRIVRKVLYGGRIVTLAQYSDVLRLDNTHFYLGFSGHKPVTACMTITQGDTSVLEMVATLPKYRRRGFASALINQALIDLRQQGVKTVTLRAEADGVSVYKRLGFHECFKCVVASYDWKGD